MEEEQKKLGYIADFAIRDLDLPYSILTSLLRTLNIPPSSFPPPLARLLLLRHLLSLTASLNTPQTLEALKTLEYLLPRLPSGPPSSLCRAYSSLVFYLQLSPNVSSSDVNSCISHIANYHFSGKVLAPWFRMLSEEDKSELSERRDKAVLAMKEFIDEQFRAMEPPFLLSAVQRWLKENQKVAGEITNLSSQEESSQNGAQPNINSQKESSQNGPQPNINQIHQAQTQDRTSTSKLNGTASTSKFNPNYVIQRNINGTSKLNRNYVIQRNIAGTSGTGTNLNINFQKDLGENRDKTRKSEEISRGKNVNNPSKRRRGGTWHPHEEQMLRKAVKEIGKGNWKEILDKYPNEFKNRTQVDLKDKWRNMTR